MHFQGITPRMMECLLQVLRAGGVRFFTEMWLICLSCLIEGQDLKQQICPFFYPNIFYRQLYFMLYLCEFLCQQFITKASFAPNYSCQIYGPSYGDCLCRSVQSSSLSPEFVFMYYYLTISMNLFLFLTKLMNASPYPFCFSQNSRVFLYFTDSLSATANFSSNLNISFFMSMLFIQSSLYFNYDIQICLDNSSTLLFSRFNSFYNSLTLFSAFFNLICRSYSALKAIGFKDTLMYFGLRPIQSFISTNLPARLYDKTQDGLLAINSYSVERF